MNRERVATEMRKQFRRKGLLVQPNELDAFVTSLPVDCADLGPKALVQQFIQESRAYRWNARYAGYCVLILVFGGLQAFVAGLVGMAVARDSADVSGKIDLGALIGGFLSTCLGVVLVSHAAIRIGRFCLALRAAKRIARFKSAGRKFEEQSRPTSA